MLELIQLQSQVNLALSSTSF